MFSLADQITAAIEKIQEELVGILGEISLSFESLLGVLGGVGDIIGEISGFIEMISQLIYSEIFSEFNFDSFIDLFAGIFKIVMLILKNFKLLLRISKEL